MTDEELALLQAIRREPENDAPRLEYADYLGDHGEMDRAQDIYLGIEHAEAIRSGDIEKATKMLEEITAKWRRDYLEFARSAHDRAEYGLFDNYWLRRLDRGFIKYIMLSPHSLEIYWPFVGKRTLFYYRPDNVSLEIYENLSFSKQMGGTYASRTTEPYRYEA